MVFHSTRRIVFAARLALLLAPSIALGHWCDDLWDSAYNIVVRPESDTVAVPESGTATLNLYVQNNMGYALSNFAFRAEADGYTITSVRTVPRVSGYLMPGEKLKYILTIGRNGGVATLDVTSLEFYVNFAGYAPNYNYRQDRTYQSNPVMLKKSGGGLYPSSISKITGNEQAQYLISSANADYFNLTTGLADLLDGVPGYISGEGSYQYDSLWSAAELAVRRSGLNGTQLTTLRTNLQTTWSHPSLTFKAFSSFVLGYLGSDSTSRTFLEDKLGGDADEAAFANAALCVMGESDHCNSLNLSANSDQAKMVAAAALRITGDSSDDTGVGTELIDRARFTYFSDDDGVGLMAAHLLNLVAWEQRGWAVNAGDTGEVSFLPVSSTIESGDGGGGGGTSSSSGCGFGAGSDASLLVMLLVGATRRRRT